MQGRHNYPPEISTETLIPIIRGLVASAEELCRVCMYVRKPPKAECSSCKHYASIRRGRNAVSMSDKSINRAAPWVAQKGVGHE